MAARCHHRPEDLEVTSFYTGNGGQEFGQVRCNRCRTRWSIHSKEKNVTRFIVKLKATGQLKPKEK